MERVLQSAVGLPRVPKELGQHLLQALRVVGEHLLEGVPLEPEIDRGRLDAQLGFQPVLAQVVVVVVLLEDLELLQFLLAHKLDVDLGVLLNHLVAALREDELLDGVEVGVEALSFVDVGVEALVDALQEVEEFFDAGAALEEVLLDHELSAFDFDAVAPDLVFQILFVDFPHLLVVELLDLTLISAVAMLLELVDDLIDALHAGVLQTVVRHREQNKAKNNNEHE